MSDHPSSASPIDGEFIEIDRGDTVWRFDRAFLESNWTCIYGRGCKGILDEPAEQLQQGCCSLGAHFGDGPAGEAEAMAVSAYAELLDPVRFQHHDEAQRSGVFSDETRTHTRVVDDACIFLNRAGFAGGVGCALHLGALDAGESPTEWKPSVCWQLPLHLDFRLDEPTDVEIATVRRWGREQWGEYGESMAWCCTERADGGEAYVGDARVVDSMRDELVGIAGETVYVELRRRLSG